MDSFMQLALNATHYVLYCQCMIHNCHVRVAISQLPSYNYRLIIPIREIAIEITGL